MKRPRKIAALAGAGAALIGSSVVFAGRHGDFAGLSIDFWRGVPIGMGASFVAAAAIMMIAKRTRRGPDAGL